MPKDLAEKMVAKLEAAQAWLNLLDAADNALRAMQRSNEISAEVWSTAMGQLSGAINAVRGES